MARIRISTTVDERRLGDARRMTGLDGSKLMDKALEALIGEAEREALERSPYDQDPDLAWTRTMPPPDLPPYEGRAAAGQKRPGRRKTATK